MPSKKGKQDNERDNHELKDILVALRSKPKITTSNVMNFMDENSIDDYPDIDQLVKKYGSNNVCIERMKLKLD